MFYFKDSTISNSKFVGISIQHNASSPYGGVVKSQNCSYIDTVFKKIETKYKVKYNKYVVEYINHDNIINSNYDDKNIVIDNIYSNNKEDATVDNIYSSNKLIKISPLPPLIY